MKLAPLLLAFAACNAAPNNAPAPPTPIALALVIDGQEVWIGNDEVEPDPLARYAGALDDLRSALAQHPPSASLPKGSEAVVITYSVGARVRRPMGPLEALTPQVLGTQADYHGALGSDVVEGVALGIAELAKTTGKRRVMVVIGDGDDSDNDRARVALAKSKQLAMAEHVEIYAFVYESAVSLPGQIVDTLTPNVRTINAATGFSSAFAELWVVLGSQAALPGQ